jgi:hypothetical protein
MYLDSCRHTQGETREATLLTLLVVSFRYKHIKYTRCMLLYSYTKQVEVVYNLLMLSHYCAEEASEPCETTHYAFG